MSVFLFELKNRYFLFPCVIQKGIDDVKLNELVEYVYVQGVPNNLCTGEMLKC